MENKFKTVSELLKDECFRKFVSKQINEIKENRSNRPIPPQGSYYKRDWYDVMIDNRQLDTDYFISTIENIWAKKSSLSSNVRQVIQYICDRAFQQTLLEYTKKESGEVEVVKEITKPFNPKHINSWIAELRRIATEAKVKNEEDEGGEVMSKSQIDDLFCKAGFIDRFKEGLSPQEAFDLEMEYWDQAN
jgi:hypothetical protein